MKVLFALLCAVLVFAQDGAVFRSGVSLVRVDVEAIDTAGRVVTGLTKEDFRVSDEGMPQSLVNFSFEEEPLDLILLFDTAGSMHGKLLSVVRATELGFNELHNGDRVCVRAFSAGSTEMQPFIGNLQAVNEAILIRVLQVKFAGASRIGPAADEAALRFRNEPKSGRKRAILVVTDKATDKAGAREPNEAAIVRDLWNSDAVLSELVLDHGQTGTNGIVDKTGGATIAAAGNPGEAFRDSVHYLRSGYTIYYAQPAAQAGTERKLEVELTTEAARKSPGVKLRARTGYIVP